MINIVIILYFITSLIVAIYSYALVDPGLTLINHPLWAIFRTNMVNLGYFNRGLSIQIYLILVAILFLLQYIFLRKCKGRPILLALAIGLPLIFSYPLLSHDFFNYIFDAKIFTTYHLNPYFFRALDFPHDPWIRFMHWTHRTYPYGPSFLLITLVPSLLGSGKLIFTFVFFKATWVLLYILSVFLTEKIDRKFALFFATSPFVVIEGLVNSHNDFVSTSLLIVGIYLLFRENKFSKLLLLLSGAVKYFTLPALLLTRKNNIANAIVLVFISSLMIYYSVTATTYPWYLLNIIPFLLYFPKLRTIFTILSFGFLMSYYPYIAIGENINAEYGAVKNGIIIFTIIITALYAVYKRGDFNVS